MKANKFINLFLVVVFVFFTICQANSKMAGINHSNSRSQCCSSSKILATIGNGDLRISDTQNSDDLFKDDDSQAKESTARSNAYGSNQMSGMQTSGSIRQSSTSLQDKKNDTDPKSKISSINYSNNRNLSYSMSKSLATIGRGELIVGDKDISSLSKDELASLQSDPNNKALYNSDDLRRLNRDSSKLSKELYSTKLSSNVDASVDMRLFSEGGMDEIKRDYEDASTIYDAIYQIATTDRVSFTDFFSENGKGFMTVNAVRQEIANNPELRRMLQSDELSDQEKQAITQNITRQVMINLGYIPNQTKTIYTDETGRDGKQIMGFYSLQTKRSYINIKNNESTKDLVATSATESQRAMDHQRGINFLQNEDDHSTYSQNFGNAVARYYGYALSSYGNGYGSAKINNRGSINQNYYVSNNKEFSRLDKQKGANRQLHQEEVEWLNDRQKIAKFKDYIQKATSKRYTDDEAKKILAKGGISLSDESFNEAYKESLSDDELADIGLAKEYIKQSDFYNKDLDGTNAFNPTAGQYWERYVYSENAYANKDFYIKNLYLNKGMGILDYVKSTAYGLYGTAEGYVDGIEDMGNMVLHPIDTVGNIFSVIIHPLRTRQAISDSIDEHQADNFVDAMIGDQSSINRRNYHTLGEAAAGLGTGKLSSKLNKAGKVVGKADEVAKYEVAKLAPSTEQVKKVFVYSKSANSDLATLVNNIKADYIVTSKGITFSVSDLKNLLALQGTSAKVGDFTGLTGASFEEIFSRAPKDWKVMLQNDGKGIKFVEVVDGKEIEKIRIHAPENNPNLPSTANTNSGWVLRIPFSRKKYFDDTGKILPYDTDETHIPIKGNPNAN